MTHPAHHTIEYQKAASMLKVQAILSIVFGGLGILFGIVATFLCFIAASISISSVDSSEYFIFGILLPIFWVIPHIYLLISGIVLLRTPSPKLAKVLSIINIVFGALYNLVVLIFAVLYIAQSLDYEKGYKATK